MKLLKKNVCIRPPFCVPFCPGLSHLMLEPQKIVSIKQRNYTPYTVVILTLQLHLTRFSRMGRRLYLIQGPTLWVVPGLPEGLLELHWTQRRIQIQMGGAFQEGRPRFSTEGWPLPLSSGFPLCSMWEIYGKSAFGGPSPLPLDVLNGSPLSESPSTPCIFFYE